MPLKPIKIKFQNGINKSIALEAILSELLDAYEFIETDDPDFILFGPYGNDIPKKDSYTRIGYYCENFTPDLNICEWAFGVPREAEITYPNYRRIQWHGIDPQSLVKPIDFNTDEIAGQN